MKTIKLFYKNVDWSYLLKFSIFYFALCFFLGIVKSINKPLHLIIDEVLIVSLLTTFFVVFVGLFAILLKTIINLKTNA